MTVLSGYTCPSVFRCPFANMPLQRVGTPRLFARQKRTSLNSPGKHRPGFEPQLLTDLERNCRGPSAQEMKKAEGRSMNGGTLNHRRINLRVDADTVKSEPARRKSACAHSAPPPSTR
jgi:hypothetical protein